MTLPLEPPLAPMLAKATARIPAAGSPGGPYVYEPKWDGFRAIVFSGVGEDGDGVELISRTGRPLTRYFPEIIRAVKAELPPRIVLDGEIVVARGSRLDFSLLSQRIHPAASRVKMLSENAPANLVVFDLLALEDEVYLDRPLRERIEALEGLDLPGPQIHATPRSYDVEVANEWLAQFEGAGLDGVMAKPLDAPYAPGKRAMFKIKHARTADVVLAGYREHKDSTPQCPLLGSLLLGLYEGDLLHFVGVCASFPTARREALIQELAPLVVDGDDSDALAAHPWGAWADPAAHAEGRKPGAQSRWSAGKDLSFVPLRIARVLEVGYDHMEGTRFRHTTQFKRWRVDREPASCTFEQLEEVAGYDLAQLLPGAPAAPADFYGAPAG